MKINKKITLIVVIFILAICGANFVIQFTNNITFIFFYQLGLIIIKILEIILAIYVGKFVLMFIYAGRDNNIVKCFLYIMTVGLVIIFTSANIFGQLSYRYQGYKINNELVGGFEMFFYIFIDNISRKTINIQTDDVRIDSRSKNIDNGSTPIESIEYYFLNINDNEYVIPIGNEDKVYNIIKYGKINTITMYKYSKMIKAVNGIEI